MARYDFLCTPCNRVTELNLPISERNDPQVCQECSGSMERLMSFKDTGIVWATTGGTRTFDSRKMPKLPDINSGHNDLTMGMLGLTEPGDDKKLGI